MDFSGWFSCAVISVALASVAAPGAGLSPPPRAVASSAAPVAGCGSTSIPKAGGGTWVCSFADNFNGDRLDLRKWDRMVTADSGYTSGPECYLASGPGVRVRNGALVLTVARAAKPFRCESPRGDYTSQYTGGSVSTFHHFSQTYGRFEIRARFPAVDVPGLQSALWLWPRSPTYGTVWPSSGEIDIGEFFTRHPDRVIPTLHYLGDSLDPNRTNNYCYVTRPQDYHKYLLTWGPRAISIRYDGKLCLRNDNWQPLLMSRPKPFDHPFVVNLTQALGVLQNAFQPSRTPLPASMRVDYVRVWR